MSVKVKRVRPEYDRERGTRTDGAVVYRACPIMKRGSKPCACGRTISANKEKCAACAGVAK